MKYAIIGVGIVLVLGLVFFSPISYEQDWYWHHVQECLDAHEAGYAISICSGWWVNVSDVEEDGPCLVMPWENPLFTVYHGSISGQYSMAYNRFHFNSIIANERKEMSRMIDWWFENHAHKYENNPSREDLYKWYCNFRGIPEE